MRLSDRKAAQIIRQARSSGAGNRLAASSGGQSMPSSNGNEPRLGSDGKVRRLFVPDLDPLDSDDYFLGDEDATETL